MNLMKLIEDRNNILLAYRNIKSNTGSNTAGTDGKTIGYFKNWTTDNFVNYIKNQLKDYKPKTVRRVEIPKPNGDIRPLGIPTIEDRIVQQCIKQVLEPICEAKFHNHSYGFRPNRSTKHAIARIMYLINRAKLHYTVDVDLKGFFDNINHGKLLKQMWCMGIRDKNLLCVIKKILNCEVENLGKQTKGTPQGGIISPLLSNIVLNELDWWISDQWETFVTNHKYSRNDAKYLALKSNSKLKKMFIVRYADDFKIFCEDSKTAKKIFIAVENWISERLGLSINKEKSMITNLRKRTTEFLGLELKAVKKKGKYVCNSNMNKKSFENVKEKLKKQIKEIPKHRNIKDINRLNAMILGIHNYYNMATHVVKDMGKINFDVMRTLDNRLKNMMSDILYKSKSYEKLYGGYSGRLRNVCGITIFPIFECKTNKVMNFTQDICNYTEKGRELIHKSVTGCEKLIKHLINNSEDNIELNDNKISLIYGQKGLCQVTGKPLEIGNMECHHKLPRSLGGKDEYHNLVWINKDVNKLIHTTQEETINKHLNLLKLDTKELTKVNNLRKKIRKFNY